jgi:hypothetical protein
MHHRGVVTTGSVIDESGPPTAAAPASPARRAGTAPVRTRAGVLLLACLASLGWLGAYTWRHRVDTSALAGPPFKIADAAWRSVLTVAATTDRSCPPSVPVVILYVSSSCVHCQAELQRWASLVRNGALELSCTALTVVAAPDRGSAPKQWVPPELSSSVLWDYDRTVARALDVRLVPLAAYVTSKGIVTVRVAGEASEESTTGHLVELRRVSEAAKGGR